MKKMQEYIFYSRRTGAIMLTIEAEDVHEAWGYFGAMYGCSVEDIDVIKSLRENTNDDTMVS